MIDVFTIKHSYDKKQNAIIFKPSWLNNYDSKDVMVRGHEIKSFYNEEKGLWEKENVKSGFIKLVDKELKKEAEIFNQKENSSNERVVISSLYEYDSKEVEVYDKWLNHFPDNAMPVFDSKIIFDDTKVTKDMHATFKLDYHPQEGSIDNWNEFLHGIFPEEEEAEKIEWMIGALAKGETTKDDFQYLFVLKGSPGTGKSSVLNFITDVLFPGYSSKFDIEKVVDSYDKFNLTQFKENPLIAIDHDGDLSKITKNDDINKICSHNDITINEKGIKAYTLHRPISLMIVCTNGDIDLGIDSGMLRRLIEVTPCNAAPFENAYFNALLGRCVFERAAIVQHCIDVYNKLGLKHYKNLSKNKTRVMSNNLVYQFVNEHRIEYITNDFCRRPEEYQKYLNMLKMELHISEPEKESVGKHRYFNEEFGKYWDKFVADTFINGERVTLMLRGFKRNMLLQEEQPKEPKAMDIPDWLQLNSTKSILDEELKDCPAQYANKDEQPTAKWDNVKTTLKDIDTSKLHYVRPIDNLICIDFDIKVDGKKNREANIKAAINGGWPKTYAEYSKSGAGLHLSYYYDGDLDILANTAEDKDIEIKVYRGKSSLRRALTGCNDIPIAHLSDLPFKKEKKQMIDFNGIKDEMHLRNLINKALRKEIDSITSTHQCVSYIQKVLDDAVASGLKFNLEDMKPTIVSFAMSSTNQATACLQMVNKMIFKTTDEIPEGIEGICNDESDIIFYDVEVFKNVFICCWKLIGEGNPMHRMINPPRHDVAELYNSYKLVGFNNRSYDNHILFAWAEEGYDNMQLFRLSQRLVKDKNNSERLKTGAAYNLSYTDIMDYYNITEKMKSLKKWEVELGINHVENEYPWDEPLDESHWEEVTDYCCNDVLATEAVWNATQTEFAVRKMLARLAGGKATVNWSTNKLIETIIFGGDKHPQDSFNYRNLAEPCEGQPHFPGYSYKYNDEIKRFESTYKGMVTGEGGLVYARPGMYRNVALLDVASMHPSSIIAENLFGDEYTQRYKEIKESRLCVKHKDIEGLKNKLNGVVYDIIVNDHIPEEEFGNLAHALKIVINSVYGLTSATFDTKFRDPRNVDNIVAKRGALFMVDLKEYVESLGYTVAHIKTDSIKIPDCDENIISKVMEFGKKYGYNFELEAIYDRMCLVNNAVYIAKYKEKDGHPCDEWTATGAQFQIPYTFKTLFSGEAIDFKTDLCEIKNVTGDAKMYLDINEDLGPDEHNYVFVGKVGKFTPVKPGYSAGTLYRYSNKNGVDKYDAISGTKGYRFLLSTDLSSNDNFMDMIDYSYFDDYVIKAREEMAKFGDVERFINDNGYFPPTPADPEAVKEELLPF